MLTQKEAFGACPDYNELIGIGGLESHKATLDQRVSTFCEGVQGTILGAGEPLVLALLLSAQVHFTKMVGFIDHFYQELTQVAKFPKQPAWLLVRQCVGAVFDAWQRSGPKCLVLKSQMSCTPTQSGEWRILKASILWSNSNCKRNESAYVNRACGPG
jgi:hypothetical protein